jgi:hypothetical protein
MVAVLKEKHGAELAAIDAKYQKEADDKEKERLDSIINSETLSFAARKQGVDDALALNKKLYDQGKIDATEYTKTEKQLSDARVEISKKEAAARAENAGKISATLKNVAKAIGEQTVAGKAAAIAATTIDTYMSATSAFASLAKIPIVGVPLGIAAAAAAIAAGLKNVKSILAVKTPEVPSGTSEAGFVSIPSSGAPATGGGAMPDLGGGTMPDLGGGGGVGAGGGGETPTVRAYVVERDISDAQSRDQEIQNRARFQ